MKDFNELIQVWKQPAGLQLPSAQVVITKAKAEGSKLQKKMQIERLCLILALISMAFVAVWIRFRFISSYIAILMMVACIVIFLYYRYKQTLSLTKMDYSRAPKVMIEDFEAYYGRQKFMSTTGIKRYFIGLNLAFALYGYEVIYLSGMPVLWQLICLAVYAVWMCFAYFYLGPRQTKKENDRIEKIIAYYKSLESDLEFSASD